MAKTTRVVLVCDLHGDGTEAVTTIRMDNGTARYELDLCQPHFDELSGAGRRLRARRRTGGARSATSAAKKTAAAKTPRHGRGARTQRQCANGPASMAIRSAIAVASRVTSWKPSPPASRPCRTQDRQDPGDAPSLCADGGGRRLSALPDQPRRPSSVQAPCGTRRVRGHRSVSALSEQIAESVAAEARSSAAPCGGARRNWMLGE